MPYLYEGLSRASITGWRRSPVRGRERGRVTPSVLALPSRARGRQTVTAMAAYLATLDAWCEGLKQINTTLEFKVSSRGWCYILEEHGLGKGDFDKAQALIRRCRKAGRLPLDFCLEDASREFDGLARNECPLPDQEAENWVWEHQECHLQTPVGLADQPSTSS